MVAADTSFINTRRVTRVRRPRPQLFRQLKSPTNSCDNSRRDAITAPVLPCRYTRRPYGISIIIKKKKFVAVFLPKRFFYFLFTYRDRNSRGKRSPADAITARVCFGISRRYRRLRYFRLRRVCEFRGGLGGSLFRTVVI